VKSEVVYRESLCYLENHQARWLSANVGLIASNDKKEKR